MKVGSDLSVTGLTMTTYVGAGDVVNVNDTTANHGGISPVSGPVEPGSAACIEAKARL